MSVDKNSDFDIYNSVIHLDKDLNVMSATKLQEIVKYAWEKKYGNDD